MCSFIEMICLWVGKKTCMDDVQICYCWENLWTITSMAWTVLGFSSVVPAISCLFRSFIFTSKFWVFIPCEHMKKNIEKLSKSMKNWGKLMVNEKLSSWEHNRGLTYENRTVKHFQIICLKSSHMMLKFYHFSSIYFSLVSSPSVPLCQGIFSLSQNFKSKEYLEVVWKLF